LCLSETPSEPLFEVKSYTSAVRNAATSTLIFKPPQEARKNRSNFFAPPSYPYSGKIDEIEFKTPDRLCNADPAAATQSQAGYQWR
jgi:hypothetical protein